MSIDHDLWLAADAGRHATVSIPGRDYMHIGIRNGKGWTYASFSNREAIQLRDFLLSHHPLENVDKAVAQ